MHILIYIYIYVYITPKNSNIYNKEYNEDPPTAAPAATGSCIAVKYPVYGSCVSRGRESVCGICLDVYINEYTCMYIKYIWWIIIIIIIIYIYIYI